MPIVLLILCCQAVCVFQCHLIVVACFFAKVKVLSLEQRCGFRKSGSMVPLRHAKGNFDISIRMKAILIRRDVFKHIAAVFKNFEADINRFLDLTFYDQVSVPEPEVEGVVGTVEDDDDWKQDVSSYVSKGPLTRLCIKLAKGHFKLSLCKIASLG